MRSRWEALRQGLMQSIRKRDAITTFTAMRARLRSLARFTEPAAVVSYLNQRDGNLDEKDQILADLIEASRFDHLGELADPLLLLGLWPALSSVFRRRIRLFRQQPQDLEAGLVAAFTAQVRRFDPNRVTRVAATLVRNAERELVEARRRELAVVDLSSGVVEASSPVAAASFFDVPAIHSDAATIAAIHSWLERMVGRDAELIVSVVIYGQSCREAAAHLGLAPANARQRLGRALLRIRRTLTEKVTDQPSELSQATSESRVGSA